jgi:hypothetical protein
MLGLRVLLSVDYSILLLGLGRFFSFLILYTVGSTPWTGDQSFARPLPKQNKRTQYRRHALSGIRTYDPSVRASEDSSCLRPCGHCGRQDMCGSGSIAAPSLTSALDGGEWSASRSCRLTSRERAPGPLHRRLSAPKRVSGLSGEEKNLTLQGIEPGPSSP